MVQYSMRKKDVDIRNNIYDANIYIEYSNAGLICFRKMFS